MEIHGEAILAAKETIAVHLLTVIFFDSSNNELGYSIQISLNRNASLLSKIDINFQVVIAFVNIANAIGDNPTLKDKQKCDIPKLPLRSK